MLETGTILGGRYEILKKIGTGGMADVYMAKCHKLNRNVAIKVLKNEYVDNEKFLKKFQVEAEAVARLAHPNIVNVYDVGQEGSVNYIVMELAEGITLKEYIKKKGHLSAKETVELSLQIASAISHAHGHHTIHRDIKPQNILVSDSGQVKVTDFGIAKAANSNTVTSTAIGSVHYISPEQAKGKYCDEKSDIYSLGITMYEMATGQVPFDHENGVTIALMHLQNEITPPGELIGDIPESLEKIILKCTMKKPEDRYQSVNELIEDLKLVFEDTKGSYVGMAPFVDDSPTQLLHTKEFVKPEETEEEPEEESGFVDDDDEEEPRGMNSKIEKLVVVLAAVVGAIILISIIVLVINSSGLFRSGDNAGTEKLTTTEESTTEELEKVPVENYVGMTYDAALASIDEDLKVERKTEASSSYEAGYIIRQSLESDQEVEKGTTIVLTVSTGESKVEVPDVRGYSQKSATKILSDQGFKVSVSTKFSSSVKEGDVISQSPGAGNKISRGSKVTITVSKGENKVTVPEIVFKTVEDAREELSIEGLKLIVSSKKYDSRVPEGCIISQSPKAGKKVTKGTGIGVVVSLGKQPTTEDTTDNTEE